MGPHGSKTDPSDPQGIGRGPLAALGGEDHLVPGPGEEAPGDGDLRDVEVPVREGEEDAHQPSSPSLPAPTNQSSRRPKRTLNVVSEP